MQRIPFLTGWQFRPQADSHTFSPPFTPVLLPHDAIIGCMRDKEQFNGTKKAYFPNGAWEYINVFQAPESWRGKRIFLEFQGVQSHALVYVNGNFAARHAYPYTEFTADLTPFLKYGESNVVKVICKTGDDSRWYTGGGIFREVNLLIAPAFHIQNNGLRITTLSLSGNEAVLRAEARLSSDEAGELRFTVEREGEEAASFACPAEQGGGELVVKDPRPWSEHDPALYTCRAELLQNGEVIDTAEERFGIRTLSADAKRGLLVNGERVLLRGACIHHDNGVLGAATWREAEYRRVEKLKEAGFNAIRSAHHPASRALLDACDELGVYVMDEAFDMWQIPKSCDDYANDFNDNWKQDVAAMVEKDYNRPSVILYSIGNEISDLAWETGVSLAGELHREVKRLDNTRLTTAAVNGILLLMQRMELFEQLTGEKMGAARDVNEQMNSLDEAMRAVNNSERMDAILKGGAEAVDVAGYNYLHDRYLPDIEKYPDRVIVGSETYAKYIFEMWGHMQAYHNVIGDFTWTGWDYLGETGIGTVSYRARDYHEGFYASYPCITAGCADIDITGFRLPQSYCREIVFGLRKAPYIAVHDPKHCGEEEYLSTWGWGDVLSSWDFAGYEGAKLTVDVYASDEVELFLNGASLGKRLPERCKCTFEVPFAAGTLEAVSKGERYALTTSKGGLMLSLTAENEPRQGGLLFVNVALTDGETVRYGMDREVTLAVSGGKLLGFGSGSPFTEESYTDNVHTTCRGRAFAVILAEEEQVTIRARAEGCEAELTVLCRTKKEECA